MAFEKTLEQGLKTPILIYTRPSDVYNCRSWLVSIAFESAFFAIKDVLVAPGAKGQLDYLVISSHEGISVAWYHEQRWQQRLLSVDAPTTLRPERMGFVQLGNDPLGFIVAAEVISG